MAIRDVRDLIAVLGQRGPGKRTPPIQGNGGASNVGCGGSMPPIPNLGQTLMRGQDLNLRPSGYEPESLLIVLDDP